MSFAEGAKTFRSKTKSVANPLRLCELCVNFTSFGSQMSFESDEVKVLYLAGSSPADPVIAGGYLRGRPPFLCLPTGLADFFVPFVPLLGPSNVSESAALNGY